MTKGRVRGGDNVKIRDALNGEERWQEINEEAGSSDVQINLTRKRETELV